MIAKEKKSVIRESRWKPWAPVFPVVVLGIALWLLYHEVSEYRWQDIETSLSSIPWSVIAMATGLTLLNFLVLIGYDWLAIKAIGVRLELPKVAFASFCGFVASYNFGATLGGIPVRYRIYSTFGLSAIQIVQLSLMLGVTFWIGEFALAGFAFVLAPISIPSKLHLPFTTVSGLGWILLGIAGSYLSLTCFFRKAIRIKGQDFRLPSTSMTLAQLGVASIDFLIATGTLFVLLPRDVEVTYLQFLCIFLLASVAVVLTHVPGGVGVFELVILTMLGAEANSGVIASLLVFRVVYYLIPLLVAGLMISVFEFRQRRERIQGVINQINQAASHVAPVLIAGVVMIGGAVLLLSGATPSATGRIELLREWIPLPFIELSHFVGSLVGMAMLVVARGLQRKLDSAWWMSVGLTIAGIAASLLKGFDFEEAILLSIVLVVLILSRKSFYRKGFLLHQRFTLKWIALLSLVLMCSIWIGVFAHKHTEYQTELWWQFTFQGDAPRFLRASIGVVTGLLCLIVWELSRRTSPQFTNLLPQDVASSVEQIVNSSTRTNANLALLGDKQFVFSDDCRSFVMYAVQRRSWITMGDPIGQRDQFAELIWTFRETCDRYDGWPVFYQVDKEFLSLYLDQGLTVLKIGEEAHVPLQTFSLDGRFKSLRANRSKLEKQGYHFEVIPSPQVPDLLPRLRSVSDAWLLERKASEKGFSLGFFSDSYVARYPCAVVKRDDSIVAFANVWQSAEKCELSIDLMRYLPDSPNGLMDFLFANLFLWGKEQGYESFCMGMAPLSGLESRPLAPLWNKAINFVYRHGDHFYRFDGLRKYKQKFQPTWQPKYVASPGGLALPTIVSDLRRLVSKKRTSNSATRV